MLIDAILGHEEAGGGRRLAVQMRAAFFSRFQLRGIEQGRYVNLITTPDYFASGFNALLPLQMTLLNKFTLPVCIYMRLLPAKDHAENWVAVPLLIVESRPTLTRDIQALF